MKTKGWLGSLAFLLIGPAALADSTGNPLATLTGIPEVRSASVLILDEKHSTVLYERHAAIPSPIASITKLMTALVVLDAGQPLDEKIAITQADATAVKAAYSRLPVGMKLSRGDLMHIALMASENRAAHALGRTYPGGLEAFVDAMNAKARELNMHTARFVEPTGLSPKNVASPLDLAELVVAAARNETIREFSTDAAHTVRWGKTQLEFRNTNPLVASPEWDIVVQKTGYLSEAGRCLVVKTVIENHEVVIVLLDSFGKYTRTADVRRIRRWIESALHGPPASAVASVPAKGK